MKAILVSVLICCVVGAGLLAEAGPVFERRFEREIEEGSGQEARPLGAHPTAVPTGEPEAPTTLPAGRVRRDEEVSFSRGTNPPSVVGDAVEVTTAPASESSGDGSEGRGQMKNHGARTHPVNGADSIISTWE